MADSVQPKPRKAALEGVRVVDFTWVLAGPYCSRVLADFGAEVIKVQSAVIGKETLDSSYFVTYNRNKLGVTINMANPKGVEVCKRLIRVSDVIVENFSARVLRQWGLDWESIESFKPDTILVSMAGFGHTGPMKDYVSFGPTLHALAGITKLTTFPGHGPIGYGYSYADHVGGMSGALGVMQALNYRYRTGKGQFVDVAQLEGLTSLLSTALLECTFNGRPPKPMGNKLQHPAVAPHDVYRCKGDDRWVAIAVFDEEEWCAFCQAIGNPAWTREERFSTHLTRVENAVALDRLIEEWTLQHTAEEVMHLLQGAGVAAGVVQNGQDLGEFDAQLKERGFYVKARHTELGEVRLDGSPIRFSRTPFQAKRAAPIMGEDNDYVFRELMGMSDEEIETLTEEGVLR